MAFDGTKHIMPIRNSVCYFQKNDAHLLYFSSMRYVQSLVRCFLRSWDIAKGFLTVNIAYDLAVNYWQGVWCSRKDNFYNTWMILEFVLVMGIFNNVSFSMGYRRIRASTL